jgi:hypothetical protein
LAQQDVTVFTKDERNVRRIGMEKKGVSAEKRVTDRVHPGIFCAHESVSYSTAAGSALSASSSSGKV